MTKLNNSASWDLRTITVGSGSHREVFVSVIDLKILLDAGLTIDEILSEIKNEKQNDEVCLQCGKKERTS